MTTIYLDILSDASIAENPKNRCYFCKKRIFSAILEQAKADGYTLIIDGTEMTIEVKGDKLTVTECEDEFWSEVGLELPVVMERVN